MEENQNRKNAEQLIAIAQANPNPIEARQFLKNLSASNPWISTLAEEDMDKPSFVLLQLNLPEGKYLVKKLPLEVVEWISETETNPEFLIQWNVWKKDLKPIPVKKEDKSKSPKELFFQIFFQILNESKIKFDLGLLFTKRPKVKAFSDKESEYSLIQNSRICSPATLLSVFVYPSPKKNYKIEIYNGIFKIYEKKIPTSFGYQIQIWGTELRKALPDNLKKETLILPILVTDFSNNILCHSSLILLPEDSPKHQISLSISLTKNDPLSFKMKDGSLDYNGDIIFSSCEVMSGLTVTQQGVSVESGEFVFGEGEEFAEMQDSLILNAHSERSNRTGSCYLPGHSVLEKIQSHEKMDFEIPKSIRPTETLRFKAPNVVGKLFFYIDEKEAVSHSFIENFNPCFLPENKESFLQVSGSWKTVSPITPLNEPYLYEYDVNFNKVIQLNQNISLGVYYIHIFFFGQSGEKHITTKLFEVKDSEEITYDAPFLREPNFHITRLSYWDITNQIPDTIPTYYQSKNPDLLKPLPVGTVLGLDDFIINMAWLLWNYQMDCGEQVSSRLFAYWVLERYGYAKYLNQNIFSFLIEKLKGYYFSESALFTIWPTLDCAIKYNEKIIPNLSVYTDDQLPIGSFMKSVLSDMHKKGHSSHSFAGIDPKLVPADGKGNLVQTWNQIWKNPKAYIPLLEKEHMAGFPSTNGIWDTLELSAYRFLLYNAKPDLKVTRFKTISKDNQLTIWDQLTNLVGLTDIPETKKVEKEDFVYDYEYFLTKDCNYWTRQGGTLLNGSTSSSVTYLQALIALKRLGKNMFFELKEKQIKPKKEDMLPQEKPAFRKGNKYRMRRAEFLKRWEVGKVNYLQLELDKGLTQNGVLILNIPENIEILSLEGSPIVKMGNLVEIPLSYQKNFSIPFLPKAKGEGKIECSIYEMYSRYEAPLLMEKVDVK